MSPVAKSLGSQLEGVQLRARGCIFTPEEEHDLRAHLRELERTIAWGTRTPAPVRESALAEFADGVIAFTSAPEEAPPRFAEKLRKQAKAVRDMAMRLGEIANAYR